MAVVRTFFLALSLAAAAMPAQGQGVYVAGQGFALEQAVEQALREQRKGTAFWLVAAGEEAQRVVQGEGGEVSDLLEQVREHGGVIYACERNLPTETGTPVLPASVGLIQPPEESGPVVIPPAVEVEPMPDGHRQTRLILRTCAALQ